MAKYIPPGFKTIPTIREITAQIEIINNLKKVAEIKSLMMGDKTLSIPGFKAYIISLQMESMTPQYQTNCVKLALVPEKEEVTPDNIKKAKEALSQFGEAVINVSQNYQELPYDGYVQHDFKKQITLVKNEDFQIYALIQDILPDSKGNLFEIKVWKEEVQWCESCGDEHPISTQVAHSKYKTKEDAETAFNKLKR